MRQNGVENILIKLICFLFDNFVNFKYVVNDPFVNEAAEPLLVFSGLARPISKFG